VTDHYRRGMPRRRLGVVLVVSPPLGDAVDGLRRAFGDPVLDRVAPHVTLVPPVNVAERDLVEVLAVLRRAAGQARPLELTLGPVAAFEGHDGVAYLEVGGAAPALAALADLRRRVLTGPLDRPIDYDFVPHATVTQGVDAERLAAVLAGAASWSPQPWRAEWLTLLEERHGAAGRRWVPVAEVALAPAVIVGRGGLEVELTAGRWVDPEAALALDPPDADAHADPEEGEDGPPDARPLVVVARREGEVVGVLAGWTWGPTTEITRAWLDPAVARQGVDDHLRSAFEWAAAQRRAGPAA
jgi:2'-5' RNA ligase